MKNNVNRKNINVDKRNIIPLWNFKQEDDAILKLALYKGAISFDITGQTIVLGAKRPNNSIVEQTDGFTISGNEIDIALKNNILAVVGSVELELQITDANGTLTTSSFFITVDKKVLGINNLVASNDISAINQLVTDLQAKTEEVNNAVSTIEHKADQLMNDIQTDYNTLRETIIDENQAANLQGQITNLGSRLDAIETEINTELKNIIHSLQERIEALENSTPSTVRVQSVTLSNNSLSLNTGDKTTLTANIQPSNATNRNVTWSSNNQNVITVSSNGEITAVNSGNATITVTTEDGGYTATCSITVASSVINVTSVTLNQTNISANTIGTVYNLVATVNPSNATNKNVTWSTNNSSVASVNNGTVTINGEGNATITVTTEDGGYTATCLFTVSISEEVIIDNVLKTKSGDYLITKSGEYLAFKTPTGEPGGSEPGGSEPGGSEPGGTGILIENLGVTGIVNPMAVNQIVTLTIKYTPTDATERDVVWESLDTSALRIVSSDNDTCTIQPLKKGNSSLKVTAVKGGATKTFYFTTSLEEGVVAIESLGAKFETGASPMKVGSTATLTPKISPSNVTDSRVTWELIQQGEYASIESDYERCTITALSPGYFQIKISAVVGGASKVLYLQVIE